MSAQPLQSRDEHRLYLRLRDARAVLLTSSQPPFRAVSGGDTRRRPMAWVNGATLESWRLQGLVARHAKGWEVLARPGPRPVIIDTPQGRVTASVRENWMQRLARDLDLPGPLAEAGCRLVADGLRVEARSVRSGHPSQKVDGSARVDGEEMRTLARLDARRRVNTALAKLGTRERGVARAVCLNDRSLSEAAAQENVTPAEAEAAFRLALLGLSVFYGTMPGTRR